MTVDLYPARVFNLYILFPSILELNQLYLSDYRPLGYLIGIPGHFQRLPYFYKCIHSSILN